MIKAIELSRQISKDLEKNWLPELQEYGLFKTFEPIYKLNNSIGVLNTLVCGIISSYDPDSKWIDLKNDGYSINRNILFNLSADLSLEIYEEFCTQSNEDICECIGNYLDLIKNWKFVTARRMIDFHSKTMMQKEPDLKDVDEDKKPKVRENMSRTIREAVLQREAADRLIEELNKEYVLTLERTKQDFGADYIQKSLEMLEEPAVKSDIMSWRAYIKDRNKRKATT